MKDPHSLVTRANRVLDRLEYLVIGDVAGLIQDMRDSILAATLPVAKSKAIELLEAEVARLETHNQNLLITNSAYLERARATEAKLKDRK
jgi:hypothetical protein